MFYCRILRLLRIYSRYESLFRYVVCKYFLSDCSLSFHLPHRAFYNEKMFLLLKCRWDLIHQFFLLWGWTTLFLALILKAFYISQLITFCGLFLGSLVPLIDRSISLPTICCLDCYSYIVNLPLDRCFFPFYSSFSKQC